jgi:hypothetical protein
MPIYDCGDPDCEECKREFPDRRKAIAAYKARERAFPEVRYSGKEPTYLGDGVYTSYDDFGIWLETSNGVTVTNAVYLEMPVLASLLEYIKEKKS